MLKIKKTKDVIAEHPDYATLIRSVIIALGNKEYIPEVVEYGASAGFGKFIYYSDTEAFSARHRKAIVRLLLEDANELGEEVIPMVKSFRDWPIYGKNERERRKWEQEDEKELMRYISGGKCTESMVPNLMAWYALETVCRWFIDE